MSGKRLFLICIGISIFTVLAAQAQIAENVSVHGFGAWAAGFTDNDNRFGFATKDAEYNDYYFSLNLSSRPADNVSINSQIYFGKEDKWRNVSADSAYSRTAQILDLDYLFIQYTYSSLLGLRLGKVKSPFGIYAEVYDVGTLRPFYYLPFSVYKGLLPKSYYGLGLTGNYAFSSDLEISYDVVAGEIETQAFYLETPNIVVSPPYFTPELKGVNKSKYVPVGRDFIGAKINITPYVQGLNVGVSYMSFKGSISVDDGPRESSNFKDRIYSVLTHGDYTVGLFNIKSEYYSVRGGNNQEVDGGYVETSYHIPDMWLLDGDFQLAFQYEFYDNKTKDVVDNAAMAPSTLEHKGYAFGLNYWFNPNVVLKTNYYIMDGNVYASPVSIISDIFRGKEIQEKTSAFIVGTQFSF